MNGAVTDGHQGRVEICFKGQWGSICQDSWDYYDTEVACRQLELGTIGEYLAALSLGRLFTVILQRLLATLEPAMEED